MRITLVVVLLIASGLVSHDQPPRCSVVGDLEIRPITSKVFNNTRMLRIWLPPKYNDPQSRSTRYPVLYLNDGQNLFDACTSIFNSKEWKVDETATELIESGKIPPLIIVGIDNAGKRDRPKEYLPFPDDTLSPPNPEVLGRLYPQFLLNEVMPLVDREYRTERDPTLTGLGGSSYGAGIALYTVMTHPHIFGRLLLESPSLYAHDDYLIHEAEHFTQWPARVYVGVGSVQEPVDDVHRLRDIILRSGLSDSRLRVIEVPGAGHDEDAWATRLPGALKFLYRARASDR